MTDFSDTLYILYGSRSGNSKAVAVLANEYATHLGLRVICESMDEFDFERLVSIKHLIVAVSTHGEGEPPVPAENFHLFIHGKQAPSLSQLKYGVVALGDSSYRYFCQTGEDVDQQLEKLGGQRQVDLEKCDIDFEEKSKAWIKRTVDHFAMMLPGDEVQKDDQFVFELKLDDHLEGNAYKATVLNRVLLNGEQATHPTMNLTLSLKDSGLSIHPGDTVGVYASNSRLLVDRLLKQLSFDPAYAIQQGDRYLMLKEVLLNHYELTVLTPIVVKKYAALSGNKALLELMENKSQLTSYIEQGDVLDLVGDYPGDFSVEDFLGILRKLMPRYYSAASYQSQQPNEVDLTVRIVNYKHNSRQHEGVCSSFMWTRVEPGEKVPVFVEVNERFRLPEDKDQPVIMISAGTGIAPFRSFLQFRDQQAAVGNSWLFFGERNSQTDFFYKEELQNYLAKGVLERLDTAFSRDQEQKHYIYHKLLEQGPDVFQWIEKGARVYICGSKTTMANDVKRALCELIRINGGMTSEDAEAYLEKMRSAHRFHEDIY